MRLFEIAPAKVNLTLHVTGQRADGYHELDSLVVFTQAGDTVRLQPDVGTGLRVVGPEGAGLEGDDDNLVSKAARLMGFEGGLALDKHLPVASGIGGGSSDAAATLRLIARATGKPLPDDVLPLGADVPVCMDPRPARMRGIGDTVSPVAGVPEMSLLLVNPRCAVSTPAVFRALSTRNNPPMDDPLPEWRDLDGFVGWLAAQRNDMQDAACALVPRIANVLRALEDLPGCKLARMSGSGATCFGVFATLAAAEAAARGLAKDNPGWWACASDLRMPRAS